MPMSGMGQTRSFSDVGSNVRFARKRTRLSDLWQLPIAVRAVTMAVARDRACRPQRVHHDVCSPPVRARAADRAHIGSTPVPTANPKPLTATANRLILAADERSLQVDLVRLDWTVQVAGCVGSRDPGPSTPTQRAAAQIPEAIGVRKYCPPGVCGALWSSSWSIERTENSQAADGDPLAPRWFPNLLALEVPTAIPDDEFCEVRQRAGQAVDLVNDDDV